MKLRSIQVEQFKKFDQPVHVDGFSDGLNLIAGPNEMGKSTLLLALRAALFERHGSKSQTIKAFQPNHVEGGAPAVAVDFEMADGVYRIEKRFLRRPMARLTRPDGQVFEGQDAEIALQRVLGLDPDDGLPLDKGSPGHFGVMLIPQGQSFFQPSLSQATRHTLEELVTAEIEQLGNQSEVDAVLANVDLARLEFVDRRNKPRGRFKDVGQWLVDLQGDIDQLRHDRDELSDDIDALNAAEDELRRLEMEEADDDLRARIEALEKERAQLLRQREIQAKVAAAELHLERLMAIRAEREKRQKEEADLTADLQHLAVEEERAKKALAKAEHELSDQEAGHRDLVEAESVIGERRRCLERLNADLMQRAKIETALRAIATEVTIDLDSGAVDRVQLDGHAIGGSRDVVQVVDGLVIDIQDIGRISIQPKVEDLNRLRDDRRSLDRSIEALLDDLDLDSAEPETIELLWQQIEEEGRTLNKNREAHELMLADGKQAIERLRAAALTLTTKRDQVANRLSALNDQIEGDMAADGPAEDMLADAEAELAEAKEEARVLDGNRSPEAITSSKPAALDALISDLRARIEARARTINEIKINIGRLGAKVALRAGRGLDERLDESYRRFELLRREQARFQLDAQALGLLKETLIEAADEAKTQFEAPLAARLTPYVQDLLRETVPEVTADFGIRALKRGRPGSESFEQLSDGTREQIAILVRLAFASMLQERGLPSLVVLDDALVFSDEERLERMAAILKKAAASLQIVILTCREDRFFRLDACRLRVETPSAMEETA